MLTLTRTRNWIGTPVILGAGVLAFACFERGFAQEGELPAQLGVKALTAVKRATVLLHITTADGDKGSGSGFFALQSGLVITNAHVIGMLGKHSKVPREVEVVLDSGQAKEEKRKAAVVGVDRVNDLAVLRVEGAGLPAPLSIETKREPYETQKVYAFGFPFGVQLGKDITISETTISSLRTLGTDTLQQIQVNGGLNPGNSGGPIVNTKGEVIGVAVSVIRGTQLNFAVPAHFVSSLAHGRITDSTLGDAFLDKGKITLPVRFACLDPLNQIKEMRVEVWTGNPVKPLPASTQAPKERPGDGKRATVALTYQKGIAQGNVPLPALPDGQVYWLQAVILTQDQAKNWAPSLAAPANLIAVERKPIQINANFTVAPQRTVLLQSVSSETFTRGKISESGSDSIELDLLEVTYPETNQYLVQVFHGPTTKLASVINDRPFKLHAQTVPMFRALPPEFLILPDAGLKSRISRSVNPKLPLELRSHYDDFFRQMCTSLEATMLPLPKRKLEPMEKFDAKIALLVGKAPAKGEAISKTVDMVLGCTYVGTRMRNMRPEAVVAVTGEVKGRSKGTERARGDIVGKLGIDVDGGFVSFAQMKIVSEIESPSGDARFTYALEVVLDRQPGNTHNVKFPVKVNKELLDKGNIVLQKDAALTAKDEANPLRKGAFQKSFEIELTAGKTYVIDMKQPAGSKLDPYLRLEDKAGKVLAEDDDGGGKLDARIIYSPSKSALFRIVATSFAPKETGAFQLLVTELDGKAK